MKDVEIMSKKQCREYSKIKDIPTCVIISIYSNENKPNKLFKNDQIKSILPLRFDDSEFEEDGISSDQAKQIAKFVERWNEQVDLIVVHCEAGISRSAGIGAAILYWKFEDDSKIFENGKYCPNMRCYRQMLEAFGYSLTKDVEDTIFDKLEVNIKAYNKKNDI